MMEDLPPGFRFFPTEEELVGFYLHNKLEGNNINDMDRVIPVIDINGVEPWSLPTLAGDICRGEREQWFFFSAGQAREARGGRPNRTTESGYWKATGSPGYVYSSENRVIGVKKTMVFYKGRAPTGRKTKWKMNEYRAIQLSSQSATSPPQLRREFSLCRIYVVSGSFRAFDRRPLENNNNNNNNNPRTESHEIIDQNRVIIAPSSSSFAYSSAIDASTSSETTHIGEIINNATGVASSSTNWWNNNNNDNNNNYYYYGVHQVQEPVWEWGEINWL